MDKLPPLRGERLLALYGESIELRTVLGFISRRFGAWPMHVKREGSDEILGPKDHPIAQLLKRPNAHMSGRSCRQLECIYYELLGETIAIVLAPGQDDNDDWVYLPVPPTVVRIDGAGDYLITIGGKEWRFDEGSIVHIRQVDPCDPYGRGMGTGWAAGDEIQSAEAAAKYAGAFFANSARPEHLIMLKGSQDPKQAREAERDWSRKFQGVIKAWQTAHFVTGDWDVKTLTTDFKNLQMTEFRQAQFDAIRKLWGIPPELVGQLEQSNRATISAALEIEGRVSLGPRLQMFAEELEYQLGRIIPNSDGLQLTYPSPIPEDREYQLEVVKAAPEAFTVNEVRALAGMPKRKDGDVYMRPPDVVWEIVAGDIIDITPSAATSSKRKELPPIPKDARIEFKREVLDAGPVIQFPQVGT